MSVLKEFRNFAMKGNVVDLAVGVIIGGAFGRIVSVLVDKILMPPIGLLIGGMDFSQLRFILKAADAAGKGEVAIAYGELIQALINFIIIAWCLFIIIKTMNALKTHHDSQQPAKTPEDVTLLREIRDLLSHKTP